MKPNSNDLACRFSYKEEYAHKKLKEYEDYAAICTAIAMYKRVNKIEEVLPYISEKKIRNLKEEKT